METRDKLEQNEFASATTDEEKTKIESELRTASDWLEYESDGADAAVFEEQIKKLASITNELFNRVREHRERPEALGALRNILNISDMFHSNAINMSEDDQVFSQVELTNLRVLVDETQTWMEESVKEQALLPANVNPTKLTLRAIAEKIAALDREVKYLLNKARVTPPKKKPKKEESKKVFLIALFTLGCSNPAFLFRMTTQPTHWMLPIRRLKKQLKTSRLMRVKSRKRMRRRLKSQSLKRRGRRFLRRRSWTFPPRPNCDTSINEFLFNPK